MKTKLLLSVALTLFAYFSSFAQCESTPAGYTCVPDDAFENFLETRKADGSVVPISDPNNLGDGIMNNYVPTSKISGLTEINLFNQNIADLTGIEDFASLTKLDARGNSLTSLDVSMLALTYLDIYNSDVTIIDLSSNTALTYLDLALNELSVLNVDANTELTHLNCGGNNLTDVDVELNTKLTFLSVGGNPISTLDVSMNTLLERLICSTTSISTLNVLGNTNLKELYCSNNSSLSSIQLPNTATLTRLDCFSNSSLTSIDVSKNTGLEIFWCYNTGLTGTLDVSSNTSLISFFCHTNTNLTAIDLPDDLDTLVDIECYGTSINSLDVSNNDALQELNCKNNPNLTSVTFPVTNNTLDLLITNNTGLTSLNINGLYALEKLWSFNNPSLTTFNLPATNTLFEFDSSNTGVINLDTSMLSGLEFLRINNSSSLTSITLPNTTTLKTFWMYGHALNSIDFTPYTNLYNTLEDLDVGNGNLSSVDISMLKGLVQFYCQDNDLLTFLNIANGNNESLDWMFANFNTNLSCIQVDNKINADNKDTNNWRKDVITSYEESCNLSTTYFDLSNISIYPNPTKNKVFIETFSNVTYNLKNIQGQLMFTGNLAMGMNEIDISNLTNGMYFINLKSESGRLTQKILKY